MRFKIVAIGIVLLLLAFGIVFYLAPRFAEDIMHPECRDVKYIHERLTGSVELWYNPDKTMPASIQHVSYYEGNSYVHEWWYDTKTYSSTHADSSSDLYKIVENDANNGKMSEAEWIWFSCVYEKELA